MIYEVDYQYDEGMLPEENSVNICQLHAEMDLWATRYKLAKAAYDLARELADELEKWNCNYSRLVDAREKQKNGNVLLVKSRRSTKKQRLLTKIISLN